MRTGRRRRAGAPTGPMLLTLFGRPPPAPGTGRWRHRTEGGAAQVGEQGRAAIQSRPQQFVTQRISAAAAPAGKLQAVHLAAQQQPHLGLLGLPSIRCRLGWTTTARRRPGRSARVRGCASLATGAVRTVERDSVPPPARIAGDARWPTTSRMDRQVTVDLLGAGQVGQQERDGEVERDQRLRQPTAPATCRRIRGGAAPAGRAAGSAGPPAGSPTRASSTSRS